MERTVHKGKITKYKNRMLPYIFIAPCIILILLFDGYPIIKSIINSFYNYRLNVARIDFIGLKNYIDIFSDKDFGLILSNTLWWVIFSVGFQFLLGLGLALLLNSPFRGKGIYQSVVLVPWAVPGFLIALIWKWIYNGQHGVLNDILLKLNIIEEPVAFLSQTNTSLPSAIVSNVWFGIPFFAIMLLAALQSIPEEIYDAASIDGANKLQMFFKIIFAYIKPTVKVTILLRVIWAFNTADVIYILTSGGPRNSSQTLATFIMQKAYSELNFGHASALGVIFILILLAYTFIYFAFTKFGEEGDH